MAKKPTKKPASKKRAKGEDAEGGRDQELLEGTPVLAEQMRSGIISDDPAGQDQAGDLLPEGAMETPTLPSRDQGAIDPPPALRADPEEDCEIEISVENAEDVKAMEIEISVENAEDVKAMEKLLATPIDVKAMEKLLATPIDQRTVKVMPTIFESNRAAEAELMRVIALKPEPTPPVMPAPGVGEVEFDVELERIVRPVAPAPAPKPAPVVVVDVRDPECTTLGQHRVACDCRGAMRGPIKR